MESIQKMSNVIKKCFLASTENLYKDYDSTIFSAQDVGACSCFIYRRFLLTERLL